MTEELREVVISAATRPEIVEAVRRVHSAIERAVEARRPRCDASGRCCRFEEYGHRLYVTTMELAAFVARLPPPGQWPEGLAEAFRGAQVRRRAQHAHEFEQHARSFEKTLGPTALVGELAGRLLPREVDLARHVVLGHERIVAVG